MFYCEAVSPILYAVLLSRFRHARHATFIKPITLIAAAFVILFWSQTAFAATETISLSLRANRAQYQALQKPASGIAITLGRRTDEVEVQMLENGKWSPWHEMKVDNDAEPWESSSQLIFTDDAEAVRVRSTLNASVKLHAIAVDSTPVENRLAAARQLTSSVIIPRWQWLGVEGERLRVSKRGSRKVHRAFDDKSPQLSDLIYKCDRRAYLYPEEYRVTKRQSTEDIDGDGLEEPLIWPVGYSEKIYGATVHHTAESSNAGRTKSDAQRMRAIYEYHTVARGWGDVGYNFVIGPSGTIFEGRAGGDYVVGAHNFCNNVGRMGISLMGNFQAGKPTDAQLMALRYLLVYLADKYDFNPIAKTIYHGKPTPTIVGHRDLGQTACPGNNSHELLPQIRVSTKNKKIDTPMFSSVAAPSSQQEAALTESLVPVQVSMGSQKQVVVKYMNVGLDTWNENTWLLGEEKEGVYFTEYRPHSFVAAGFMQEPYVKPGEIGTFIVNVQGGLSERSGEVSLTPVINNARRLISNVAKLHYTITRANSQFTHVTSYYPTLHKTGEDLTVTAKILNSGAVPWEKETITELEFDLEGGSGEVSVLNHPVMVEPGKQGTFRIRLQNVEEEGQYSRILVPHYAEGSKLVGSTITVASRAEPIPNIRLTQEVVRHNDASSLYPKNPTRKARQSRIYQARGVEIEERTGTELTLSPREQGTATLRIRAGKEGIGKFQRLASVVRSHPTIVLRLEVKGDQRRNMRINDYLESPVALKRYQVEDVNLTILAPSKEGTHTFSIGNLNFTIHVSPTGRYTIRKSTAPTLRISRRTQTIEQRKARRLERRKRIERTTPPPVPSQSIDDTSIRIRLSYDKDHGILDTDGVMRIEGGGNIIFTKSPAHLTIAQNQCKVITADGQFLSSVIRLFPAVQPSFTTVMTMGHEANRFRGTLECRVIGGKMYLINELPMEVYLSGLAEEPDSEPYEKQRAFAIAARSYALHYVISDQRKFPGMPFDGSDSPAEFQKYGGVRFEEINPRWVDAVRSTEKKVLLWQRKVVKAPYHSRNDGRTQGAINVWGWLDTPYLDAKDDPHCVGMNNWGHGVGMSGCGSKGFAEEGKLAEWILGYYYPGTKIGRWKGNNP
jgi:hypothetical protein